MQTTLANLLMSRSVIYHPIDLESAAVAAQRPSGLQQTGTVRLCRRWAPIVTLLKRMFSALDFGWQYLCVIPAHDLVYS